MVCIHTLSIVAHQQPFGTLAHYAYGALQAPARSPARRSGRKDLGPDRRRSRHIRQRREAAHHRRMRKARRVVPRGGRHHRAAQKPAEDIATFAWVHSPRNLSAFSSRWANSASGGSPRTSASLAATASTVGHSAAFSAVQSLSTSSRSEGILFAISR